MTINENFFYYRPKPSASRDPTVLNVVKFSKKKLSPADVFDKRSEETTMGQSSVFEVSDKNLSQMTETKFLTSGNESETFHDECEQEVLAVADCGL
jgi:hypothetical protein